MSKKVFSATTVGLESQIVEVEVDSTRAGLHQFNIVGLPDAAIKESKDRVSAAIKNSGFRPPHQCGRITVNLAPADIKKEGPIYDLPIALGFLLATKQIDFDFRKKIFLGELSLNGKIRSVKGVLPMGIAANKNQFEQMFVPQENALEGFVSGKIEVFGTKNLEQLINHLEEKEKIKPINIEDPEKLFQNFEKAIPTEDMSFIRGQEFAKRALEIAASGGHNILLSGPPGSGKTMLAKACASILPRFSLEESLEVTKIFSIAGLLPKNQPLIKNRQFRTPHHSASAVSLVGGGTYPRPGEISLAHRGVLFLDEFPEFSRSVLENLRQPLEDGLITVSRAQGTLKFPASFTLIAAMNPCPCGNATDPEKQCTCSPAQIIKYQRKISGPIMDRIDLHIDVPRVKIEKLSQNNFQAEKSDAIRERVEKTRKIQEKRFKKSMTITNSEMTSEEIKKYCSLGKNCSTIMKQAISNMHLSARSYFRIIKIARTIADMSQNDIILPEHITESLQYRFKID